MKNVRRKIKMAHVVRNKILAFSYVLTTKVRWQMH